LTDQWNFRPSQWLYEELMKFRDLNGLTEKKEIIEGYIQSLKSNGLSPRQEGVADGVARPPPLQQDSQIPFETQSVQVRNESESLQKASTVTSNNLKIGVKGGNEPKLSMRALFEERLWYHERKAAIYKKAKMEAAKESEQARQVVKEQVRRFRNQLPQSEPYLKSPCPLGRSANRCLNNPCDNRGQCRRENRIGQINPETLHGALCDMTRGYVD
jgi:hypothetical protein